MSFGNTYDSLQSKLEYTLPGVIHFLQQEWKRFEGERNEWSVERSLLQSRIVVLEGERRGLENLKNDLLRRIKMLEFALRQERTKHLNNSGETAAASAAPAITPALRPRTLSSGATEDTKPNAPITTIPSSNGKSYTVAAGRGTKSRQILQKYLEEMGHNEDVLFEPLKRSEPSSGVTLEAIRDQMMASFNERVRAAKLDTTPLLDRSESTTSSILPVSGGHSNKEDSEVLSSESASEQLLVDATPTKKSLAPSIVPATPAPTPAPAPEPTKAPETEQTRESTKPEEEHEEEDDEEKQVTVKLLGPDVQKAMAAKKAEAIAEAEAKAEAKAAAAAAAEASKSSAQPAEALTEAEQIEQDAASAFNISSGRMKSMMKGWDGSKRKKKSVKGDADKPATSAAPAASEQPAASAKPKVTFDDLADLSMADDSEKTLSEDQAPPKQWKMRATLRSHYDSVRSAAFTEDDMLLVSASEDGTLKLWNVETALNPKAVSKAKKDGPADPEPIHTFRGHTGPVFSIAIGGNSQTIGDGLVACFSGGQDTHLRMWGLPPADKDLYAASAPEFLSTSLVGHTDVIWDVRVHPVRNLVVTASADSTWRLWSFADNTLKLTANSPAGPSIVPTSVDFIMTDLKKVVASYTNSSLYSFDIEYGKPIITFDSTETYDGTRQTQINKVITHPTLPLIITAHEDKYIRFFDANSGKAIHSMIAHRDAVSCLAVNPSGLSLMSGGHDSSIRGWDIQTYTCIQEFSSHRKKNDEAVHAIAFHSSSPLLATAGTDATVKIYS